MSLVRRILSARVLLILSTPTVACGGGENSATWTGRRDTVGAVEIVRNPFQPILQDGRTSVRRVWATSNTGPSGFWERPRWLAEDGERVYVLDLQAHLVFILDAETGADLGTVGGEGAGPGEFRRPFGVGISGSELLVGNGGGPGWVVFGANGVYRRNVRFPFRPILFEVLSDGRLLVVGLGGPGSWLVGRDGTAEPFIPVDTSVVDASLVFSNCPRYGAGTRGVLRAQCRRFAFQELAPTGGAVREVHVARPAVVASDEELRFQEEGLRRSMAGSGLPAPEIDRFVKDRMERARIKGVYNGIRVDRKTGWVYLLEQNPPDLPGSPAIVHVFDDERRYLAAISFQHSWEDYRASGDRLFALARDAETGLITAVAYQLDFPL